MPRDVRAYLADIIDACDAIAVHVGDYDFDQFVADRTSRHAVERCVFVMGEAVNQLRQLEPLEVHTLGDVHRIVTVRNILAHSYLAVKYDLVWTIVVDYVPRLRAAAQQWIDLLEPPAP